MRPILPLIITAALLSSCGSSQLGRLTPPAPSDPAPTNVSGQLSSWSEAGEFRLVGAKGGVLASSQIGKDGTFSAELTTDAATLSANTQTPEAWMAWMGCAGTLNTSDPSAELTAATMGMADNGAGYQRWTVSNELKRVPGDHTTILGTWVYASAPTRIVGEVNCRDTLGYALDVPTTVDLDLKAGWNTVGTGLRLKLGVEGLSAAGTIDEVASVPQVWSNIGEVRDRAMP